MRDFLQLVPALFVVALLMPTICNGCSVTVCNRSSQNFYVHTSLQGQTNQRIGTSFANYCQSFDHDADNSYLILYSLTGDLSMFYFEKSCGYTYTVCGVAVTNNSGRTISSNLSGSTSAGSAHNSFTSIPPLGIEEMLGSPGVTLSLSDPNTNKVLYTDAIEVCPYAHQYYDEPSQSPTQSPSALPTSLPSSQPSISPTLTPEFVERINCGGPDYVDKDMNLWSSDKFFVGGGMFTDTQVGDVAGTEDDVIYYSERYGSFEYQIPVPKAGSYQVTLLFAEINWTEPGKRIFDVNVEGFFYPNNDLFALGQGRWKALEFSGDLEVNDGFVSILFTAAGANTPKISGIQVKEI